ncbi:pseudouridine synthase [Pontibacter sp. HSC-36F09]|uniref:pseudouridine synthase n=1 Tax=Pontibacter sp. HSC-36F09 TaxID=2910966 RepID=UPI00209DDC2D|nr:pseudouridine synthase [Pontibacter sp. HSC-36F09]MCP2042937.1 23S rRNA pseudouridine2605 synthase [Pontibacter sp. HSC-36F09]
MATENERPSRDGEGRRSSDRNESGRPYNDRGEKKIFNRRDKGEGRDGGERRSYGNDRRDDRGDRKPYGDRREGGERRSFGGDRERREGGERKSYGDRREGGEGRSFGGDRERKSYGDRKEGGERRSSGGDRERKPYGDRREGGERRSFGGDRERKPYGDRNEGGERRSYGDRREGGERKEGGERRFDSERGERKSFGRDNREEGGERRSFGENREERGEGRSYGSDRREGGERRSFGGDRERKSYGDRRDGGERKPYSDRRESGGGRSFGGDRERKPYGDRREGGEREERGERRSFGDRREGSDRGEKRSFGGDRREGGERRSFGDRREGGERKSFDRKDSFSKGGEERRGRSFDSSSDSEHNPETPNYDLRRYKDNPRIKKTNRKGEDEDGSIRLNRYIANAGVCSRREADELILSGEIKVNGEAVTEMGFKVQPSDTVTYGKKVLSREKMVYVLLNKPKDFITTTEDPEGRKTVMSLVEKSSKERIFPVGRLDRNTTGLLLFTNDGELAQKLTHPSNEIKKIYQVELDKPITKDDFQKVVEGVELEDGKAMVDDVAMLGDSKKFLGLEIHIGRNRIVRRIFEHLGYDVVTLDRVQYAGLTKKDLPRGEWRYLSEKEVIRLKYFM